jgi:peroxiredoxin
MKAYQDGIAKFKDADTEVFGISVDSNPANQHWAQELGVTFPLLSDFMRKVSADYGILNAERGIANRATFVIDKEGKIAFIEEGKSAIDPAGAEQACLRLKKK